VRCACTCVEAAAANAQASRYLGFPVLAMTLIHATRTAPLQDLCYSSFKDCVPAVEIDCLDPAGFGAVTINKSSHYRLLTLEQGAYLPPQTTGIRIAAATNRPHIPSTYEHQRREQRYRAQGVYRDQHHVGRKRFTCSRLISLDSQVPCVTV